MDQRPRCVPAPCLYKAAGERPVPRLIHVMDREGDAYEVMMTVEDAGDSAIIRCAQNRRDRRPAGDGARRRCGASRCCAGPRAVNRKAGVPQRLAGWKCGRCG